MADAEKTREDILLYIENFAAEHGVRILYACESGSRAWGFASADSDYDIRVVFASPPERLASVKNPPRPVERYMEYEGDRLVIDIEGWSLQHFGKLLAQSNCTVFEWMRSPIVYMQDDAFFKTARAISDETNRASLIHHYRSMALGNYRNMMNKKDFQCKKYLYILRPAAMYFCLLTYSGSAGSILPTIHWEESAKRLPGHLADLMQILVDKKQTREKEPVGELNAVTEMINDLRLDKQKRNVDFLLMDDAERLVQEFQFK